MPDAQIVAFDQLRDAQCEEGLGHLRKLIGDDADRPYWIRRLSRRADGEWLLAVRYPTLPLSEVPAGYAHDRPWDWGPHNGMAVTTRHLPISEAVALLAGPSNPELEVERRDRLKTQYLETKENEGSALAERERADRARQQEHARKRPERWAALPDVAKAAFVAADQISGKQPGYFDGGVSALLLLARMLSQPGALDKVPQLFEGNR